MSNADHEPTGEITLGRRGVAALELLHSLDDDAPVTAEQRQVLAGWGGWGPLAKALGNSGGDRAWYELGHRVEKILDWQHRQDARNACDTAFYTPQAVTAAVWQVLAGLGFDGGRVLEPGCGSLRFADFCTGPCSASSLPWPCSARWIFQRPLRQYHDLLRRGRLHPVARTASWTKWPLQVPAPGSGFLLALYFTLPHLEFFDLRDLLIHDWPPVRWLVCGKAVAYAAAYAAFFLVAACRAFRRKPLT